MLLLILGLLSIPNQSTQYCQTNNVNIRLEPNTSSELLGTLSVNDSIVAIDKNANWYKINYQGQEAWVYKTFFSKEKPVKAEYWYNSKSGVLHNSNSRWYGNTKQGYYTNEPVGRACGICGG